MDKYRFKRRLPKEESKNITRNEKRRMWNVSFFTQGISFSREFYDVSYGAEELSFAAACNCRDEIRTALTDCQKDKNKIQQLFNHCSSKPYTTSRA